MDENIIILRDRSSCDDTSAAVLGDGPYYPMDSEPECACQYGGVTPELASRVHQQNIIPVAIPPLKEAGVSLDDVNAIAFTRGPGLLGSLLVGV